jgi:hypothetical protein
MGGILFEKKSGVSKLSNSAYSAFFYGMRSRGWDIHGFKACWILLGNLAWMDCSFISNSQLI